MVFVFLADQLPVHLVHWQKRTITDKPEMLLESSVVKEQVSDTEA